MSSDDQTRQAVLEAAADEAASNARRDVCRVLVSGLSALGDVLRVSGHLFGPQRVDRTSPFGNGDDHLVALGYLSHTAAALIAGSFEQVIAANSYASSALNRQLVEVEYLAWAFAEDRQEAANWLRSTRNERLTRWQPRHLRERSAGRFRGADYSSHCEFGGHPTPAGMRHLLSDDPLIKEILIFEIAQHGSSTWDYLLLGLVALCLEQGTDPHDLVPNEPATAVGNAEGAWRQVEQLGSIWRSTPAS